LVGTRERYIVEIVPRVLQLLQKVYSAIVKRHQAIYAINKEKRTMGMGKRIIKTI